MIRLIRGRNSSAGLDRGLLREPSNPNIPIAHRIPVVLQHQGTFRRNTLKLCRGRRRSFHRRMILNQNAIVQHRE